MILRRSASRLLGLGRQVSISAYNPFCWQSQGHKPADPKILPATTSKLNLAPAEVVPYRSRGT